MIKDIKGLHHITSMASDAQQNNRFFTDTLGLRRVKKTVNFDDPSVYHLYYGDENGTPGTVMTYFPFPNMMLGRPGVGEVGETQFAVPKGALSFWKDRFTAQGVGGIETDTAFGATPCASLVRMAMLSLWSKPQMTSAPAGSVRVSRTMLPSADLAARVSICTIRLRPQNFSASWVMNAQRLKVT